MRSGSWHVRASCCVNHKNDGVHPRAAVFVPFSACMSFPERLSSGVFPPLLRPCRPSCENDAIWLQWCRHLALPAAEPAMHCLNLKLDVIAHGAWRDASCAEVFPAQCCHAPRQLHQMPGNTVSAHCLSCLGYARVSATCQPGSVNEGHSERQ